MIDRYGISHTIFRPAGGLGGLKEIHLDNSLQTRLQCALQASSHDGAV
jgi:hypothetical protein